MALMNQAACPSFPHHCLHSSELTTLQHIPWNARHEGVVFSTKCATNKSKWKICMLMVGDKVSDMSAWKLLILWQADLEGATLAQFAVANSIVTGQRHVWDVLGMPCWYAVKMSCRDVGMPKWAFLLQEQGSYTPGPQLIICWWWNLWWATCQFSPLSTTETRQKSEYFAVRDIHCLIPSAKIVAWFPYLDPRFVCNWILQWAQIALTLPT